MRLKKGIKSFGAAIKKVPGYKKPKQFSAEISLSDTHKITLHCFGNQHLSEIWIEEMVWSEWEEDEMAGAEEQIDWDYDLDGLWNEGQEIALTVKYAPKRKS